MHGAFAKIVRRSIRGSLGRFLAIIGIVALGCGFFAGLQMSGPDMRASADRYYDGTHLWDIRLLSTLGFSDDDVQRVRDIEGIADAMPSISTDVMMQTGDEQTAVRVSLLPDGASDGETSDGVTVASDDDEYLNRLLLRDGRWPTAEDECVVSADTAAGEPRIGQTIRVLYGTDALDETLDSREFTVVGTVSSSNYPYTVSFGSTTLGSGMIEQYLYAPRDAFAADAAYTEIYATVEGADAHESGSDDYEQTVTRVADRIDRTPTTWPPPAWTTSNAPSSRNWTNAAPPMRPNAMLRWRSSRRAQAEIDANLEPRRTLSTPWNSTCSTAPRARARPAIRATANAWTASPTCSRPCSSWWPRSWP